MISLKNEPITKEVNNKFKEISFSEPQYVAFAQDEQGKIHALGITFKDTEGNETKIVMHADVFLGWSIQMANQIGNSFKTAKEK